MSEDGMDYDTIAARKVAEANRAFSQLTLDEAASGSGLDFEGRAAARVAKSRSESRQLPVQVPLWPEPQRAAPNSLLRSALFSCSRRSEFVKDAELPSWGDTRIAFTGERLNQFDESVWLQLVHLHRGQSVADGHETHSSARALLRSLGLRPGGSGLTRLERSITRLMGAVIKFQRGDDTLLIGGPVQGFGLNEATGRYGVQLNPDFLKLLNDDGVTRLGWETRKALPTGIATWMHRYVLSHRTTKQSPHRVGLDLLRRLTGMTSSQKEFKRHLKRTMQLLESRGVVGSWGVTPNNSLEFVRPPRAQTRQT